MRGNWIIISKCWPFVPIQFPSSEIKLSLCHISLSTLGKHLTSASTFLLPHAKGSSTKYCGLFQAAPPTGRPVYFFPIVHFSLSRTSPPSALQLLLCKGSQILHFRESLLSCEACFFVFWFICLLEMKPALRDGRICLAWVLLRDSRHYIHVESGFLSWSSFMSTSLYLLPYFLFSIPLFFPPWPTPLQSFLTL